MRYIENDKPRGVSIGGTAASAILGENPYSAPFDVWAFMTGLADGTVYPNKYIHWGLLAEPALRKHYEQFHGCELKLSPSLCLVDEPWFTGTPDALVVGETRGVEFKTASSRQAATWGKGNREIRTKAEADGEVPIHYWIQCQWYMYLMGYTSWDLCVRIDSADYREYRIYPDEEWMAHAYDVCRQFWYRHVVAKSPPPIDWGSTVKLWVDAVTAERVHAVLDVDGFYDGAITEASKLYGEITEVRKDIRCALKERAEAESVLRESGELEGELSRKLETIKNKLRVAIGPYDGIRSSKGEVTWKENSRGVRTMRVK